MLEYHGNMALRCGGKRLIQAAILAFSDGLCLTVFPSLM